MSESSNDEIKYVKFRDLTPDIKYKIIWCDKTKTKFGVSFQAILVSPDGESNKVFMPSTFGKRYEPNMEFLIFKGKTKIVGNYGTYYSMFDYQLE